jgi:diguanylate cyclase (GGDEF)-like protein
MKIEIPDDVFAKWQNIVDTMAKIIAVPAGLIMRVVDEDIQVFIASKTEGNPYQPGDREHLVGSGLYCETVIGKDQKLLVPHALKEEQWKDNPDVKLSMISYLGFPIRWPDHKPFGTICVLDSRENAYSELHENLIREFRDVIEQYLQLIHVNVKLGIAKAEMEVLNEELKVLASTDGLTGTFNRRRFGEILDQEWRRASRDRLPLSVLLIDVDHFKQLNDEYGHLRGDEALKMVARVLKTMVARAGDVVARFGGEEFAVLLPNTGLHNAEQLGESIRRAVARTVFFHAEGRAVTGTVCVGVASVVPSADRYVSELLKDADAALYRAKVAGRNRVEVCE